MVPWGAPFFRCKKRDGDRVSTLAGRLRINLVQFQVERCRAQSPALHGMRNAPTQGVGHGGRPYAKTSCGISRLLKKCVCMSC